MGTVSLLSPSSAKNLTSPTEGKKPSQLPTGQAQNAFLVVAEALHAAWMALVQEWPWL